MSKVDFDYGVVDIGHRLNINKPINHDHIILDKCICMGMVHKCNMNGTDNWWEYQIIYRDENFESKLFIGKIDDYYIQIKHLGNMRVEI